MADNHPLNMVRDTLDAIPHYALPTGYRFRPFRAGDEQTWTRIQRAAEPLIHVTDALFAKQFGSRPEALPRPHVFHRNGNGRSHWQRPRPWWENEGREPC